MGKHKKNIRSIYFGLRLRIFADIYPYTFSEKKILRPSPHEIYFHTPMRRKQYFGFMMALPSVLVIENSLFARKYFLSRGSMLFVDFYGQFKMKVSIDFRILQFIPHF